MSEGRLLLLLKKCPRCDEDHENLEMHAFTNPPQFLADQSVIDGQWFKSTYGFWVICPTTEEPALITSGPPGLIAESKYLACWWTGVHRTLDGDDLCRDCLQKIPAR